MGRRLPSRRIQPSPDAHGLYSDAAWPAEGRKHILAPDGSELASPTKPQPDGVLVKALARARRWQKLLDRSVYTSVTEIAEAILGGWADQRVMLEQHERPLPTGWEERRARLR